MLQTASSKKALERIARYLRVQVAISPDYSVGLCSGALATRARGLSSFDRAGKESQPKRDKRKSEASVRPGRVTQPTSSKESNRSRARARRHQDAMAAMSEGEGDERL